MIFSCWTGSYQFWWKETAGLVRCQKYIKTIYLGAEKSYILNERAVGRRKHPQYVHLSQKGTSREQPSAADKKKQNQSNKNLPGFSPSWHRCDHKQTSLVSGGKCIPFPFNYWLSIAGKGDNDSKSNSQFSAAPGVRNLSKSNKSHTENSASNISNVAHCWS